MSMGLALSLLDGALLVADSREVPLSVKGEPNDTLDKICRVGETLFATAFGLTKPGFRAIACLKLAVSDDCRPEEVAALLNESVHSTWERFLPRLGDIPQDDPRIGVALAVGGLAAGVPFVAGSLVSPNCEDQQLCSTVFPSTIVFGGEAQNARELFNKGVVDVFKSIAWEPQEGPLNNCVKSLLDVAAGVVAEVSLQSDFTGGPTRYVVIRQGFPIEKSILRTPRA